MGSRVVVREMSLRLSVATLALSLCCIGSSHVLAAPRGASTRDSGARAKRSRPKKKRGSRSFERESRSGVPVLRSRKTPGQTRTRQGEPDSETEVAAPPAAAVAAGITVTDPSAMAALLKAMPPKKVVLAGGHFRHDNVWVEFEGAFGGAYRTVNTSKLEIHYPVAGAMGRDVKLTCWHFPTKEARLIEVVSRDSDGTETVWDSVSVKPGKQTKADGTVTTLWAKELEVFIDTDVATSGATDFRIEVSSPSANEYFGCSLERIDA